MNLTRFAQARYTTKSYDPTRKIAPEVINELRELIRLAPSSVNSQPWHFIVASSDAGKARIAKATQPGFAYNESKITSASHVIVFAARTAMDPQHMSAVLEQEDRDGRFTRTDAKQQQHSVRSDYTNLHCFDRKDLQHWMEKQTYLALGTLLLGAAALEVNATPMEGFDAKVLDDELGLRERGLTSVVIVSLGYHAADDFNAALPKSRLASEAVFTDI
jgi:nitroreductase/dihydropteridine reductase